MKKLPIILLLTLLSCKKESIKPPFYIGETVYFNDINPSKSFVPLMVFCPCVVTAAYQEPDYYGWFYTINDVDGRPVTHLYENQLKDHK